MADLPHGEFSLRQLAHFVAVAEEGSISAAAERLLAEAARAHRAAPAARGVPTAVSPSDRRSIVARGIGYAILIQRPANKLSYEGLPILEKEIEPPVPPCRVIVAWPRDGRLSPRVSAVAELARRQYPRQAVPQTSRSGPQDASPSGV